MGKIDARKLEQDVQQAHRERIIRLRGQGWTNREVARIVGVSECHSRFYLPSYSPELNPDEYLNGNLNRTVRSGIPARSQKDLIKKTRSFMKTLQKRPHHVQSFLKHELVAYAA